ANFTLAHYVDHLALQVDRVDSGLVTDVDTRLNVGLLLGQKEPFEAVDLLAVDVGDATRAVSRVLELGVDDDVVAWICRLDPAGRPHASSSTTDDQSLVRHERPPWASSAPSRCRFI